MTILKRLCRWMLRRGYPAIPVALGILLALPSLWTGLQVDDFLLRAPVMGREVVERVSADCWNPFAFLDGDPQRTGKLMDHGLMPWWTDPQCRLAFWRPLTGVTHLLDYRVWPERPALMHVQSLVWFALLLWAAAVLYRRLIGRTQAVWIAALAALLFTLDDAHALPAGWLANRNATLAGLFGILTLIAHDRWRQDGWRAGAVCAPFALAVGLLCKETAASAGGYLLAYTIFLDPAPRRARLLSLLPCLGVGVVWYGLYHALGYGVSGSGLYVDPAYDPISFLCRVGRFGPILLLGQWGVPSSDLSMVWSEWAFRIHWLWAMLFLTLLVVFLLPLIVRNRLAQFWTLGMLLSVLPACAAFPMDRLLMFVGLGAMGLLAQVLGGIEEGERWVPQRAAWRQPSRLFAGALVAIHVVIAPLLFLLITQVPRLMGHESSSLPDTFPKDPALSRQTVVVVSPISLPTEWLVIHLQDFHHRPLPQRTLHLASSSSTASLTRTDDRTLEVRVQGGYLPRRGQWPGQTRPPAISVGYVARLMDRLVRGDRNPLKLGQRIRLTAATVEITELTPDGRPAEVTFRFRVPLEDASLRWFQVTSEGYTPLQLPAVGETVAVPRLL